MESSWLPGTPSALRPSTPVMVIALSVLAFAIVVVLLVRYTTPRCYLDGSRPFCP